MPMPRYPRLTPWLAARAPAISHSDAALRFTGLEPGHAKDGHVGGGVAAGKGSGVAGFVHLDGELLVALERVIGGHHELGRENEAARWTSWTAVDGHHERRSPLDEVRKGG